MHVANPDFLAQLGKLLESSPSSVFVTQKRMPSAHADVEMADASAAEAGVSTGFEGGQHSVLFRITDGKTDHTKRTKLATVVAPADLAVFTTSYLGLVRTCLSQASGLKPRSRAKHTKPDARKRDPATESEVTKAKRRGAGRRKYQRQEAHKAHLRQQRALAKPAEDARAAETRSAHAEAQTLFAAGETSVPGAAGEAPAATGTSTTTASAAAAAASGAAGTAANAAVGGAGKKKGKKGKKGGR